MTDEFVPDEITFADADDAEGDGAAASVLSPSDDALAAWLEGDDPSFDSEPVRAQDLEQASIWLRRIRRIDQKIAAHHVAAEGERARVDQWEHDVTKGLVRDRAWLVQSCVLLAQALFRENPGQLTHKTPNGRLSSTKGQASWEYTDEAAFVAWAQAEGFSGALHPPKVAPDKAAVKKLFAGQLPDEIAPDVEVLLHLTDVDGNPTGEIVPGIRVVGKDRTWQVKPS